MKAIFLFFIVIILGSCSSIDIYRENSSSDFHLEKINQILSQEKSYLISLIQKYTDDNEYQSLDFKKEFGAKSFVIRQNPDLLHKLSIKIYGMEYNLEYPDLCRRLNQIYEEVEDQFGEEHVLCLLNYKEGVPHMLLIGEKAKEALDQEKKENQNNSPIDIRNTKYKVNNSVK